MTPDSPEKKGKEEVLDLNDVAEEVAEDSGAVDVDASFEQELEDLFLKTLNLKNLNLSVMTIQMIFSFLMTLLRTQPMRNCLFLTMLLKNL